MLVHCAVDVKANNYSLTQNKEQIDPDDVQAETQTAIDVLTDLQSQLDTVCYSQLEREE